MKRTVWKIAVAYYFLRYMLFSRHRRGHGVHSPFVFEFISKVLYDRTHYSEYTFFNSMRKELKVSNQKLQVKDIGDSSVRFTGSERSVNKMLKVSSVSPKYGNLLFRIVMHYQPETLIELGTSIGLSTIYLARGNTGSKILTVEGNQTLCKYAQEQFSKCKLKNITILHCDFNEAISNLPKEFTSPQLVFIDGNHTYESTLHYFKFFRNIIQEGILIIDDIYWSAGMRKAWKEIVMQNGNYVTIDLFRMGIVLIRESITTGNYLVWY